MQTPTEESSNGFSVITKCLEVEVARLNSILGLSNANRSVCSPVLIASICRILGASRFREEIVSI